MSLDPEPEASESEPEHSTLKVKVGESRPTEIVAPGFMADSQARTRELLNALHSLVLGRWWGWFWGALMGLTLVVMAILAVYRGKPPVASSVLPGMRCLYGKVRVVKADQAEWHRTQRIPEGVRASTAGPRSRRVMLALAHDSTLRLQGSALFSWQANVDGKASVMLERGRAWVALSPLDALRLDFPGGRADLAPESVAELNLRPRPPAILIVRCRRGEVNVRLQQPGASNVGKERQFHLVEGEGVQLGKDGRMHTLSHFNADDGWQKWNLAVPGPATQ